MSFAAAGGSEDEGRDASSDVFVSVESSPSSTVAGGTVDVEQVAGTSHCLFACPLWVSCVAAFRFDVWARREAPLLFRATERLDLKARPVPGAIWSAGLLASATNCEVLSFAGALFPGCSSIAMRASYLPPA